LWAYLVNAEVRPTGKPGIAGLPEHAVEAVVDGDVAVLELRLERLVLAAAAGLIRPGTDDMILKIFSRKNGVDFAKT
jgi:hypothetical protein